MTRALDLFEGRLPAKPYCSDNPNAGVRIRSRKYAISRPWIQPNYLWYTRWIVFDVDSPTAALDWKEARIASPSIVVMNQANGHAHLMYGLEFPLAKSPGKYGKAFRWGAAVEEAICTALGADRSYGGLICRNPLHPRRYVQEYQPYPYTPEWLADHPSMDRRRPQLDPWIETVREYAEADDAKFPAPLRRYVRRSRSCNQVATSRSHRFPRQGKAA